VITVLDQVIEDNSRCLRPVPGLVSVVVNCYNGAQYLSQAIESVLAQTYPNWEIIFWDNRSTDESAKQFRSYRDKRMRYFLAVNHTPLYEARNFAIAKASGEFIAFLDVDDWWEPNKLGLQVPLFEKEQVGVVYSNYWFFDQVKGQRKIGVPSPLVKGEILNDLLKKFNVGILTVVVRRSVLDQLDGPCDKRFHIIGDFDLLIRLALRTSFDCIQSPMATYRWHQNNETKRCVSLQREEWEIWKNEFSDSPLLANLSGLAHRINSISVFQAGVFSQERDWCKALESVRSAKGWRPKLAGLIRISMNLFA
jgi:glycosyltransferase involved in cell wall biosynthesis